MNDVEITPEIIKHIANLAMISLTPEEIAKYQKQLTAILGYVKKLSEIDTNEITYTSHVELVNVLREDTFTPSLDQESATQNRKNSSRQGFFTINAVLPTDE